MAVLTVGQLKELLSNGYSDEDTLVVTWWDKSDVRDDVYDALEERDIEPDEDAVEQVWYAIANDVDNALDDQIGWVNDILFDLVQKEV